MKFKHDLIRPSSQSTSLNISCSHASCPLTIIMQILSYSTRTPIPECVWEAEDQALSHCHLSSDQGHTDLQSPCGALPLLRICRSI